MNPKPLLSVYVHIPFCLKKCGYCDFHSVAGRSEDIPQREYALAVCEELRQLKDRYGLSERRVGTIYFGGGTPTTFEPANLNIILEAIHKNLTVEPYAEVSIEANPETLFISPEGRGQSPSPTYRCSCPIYGTKKSINSSPINRATTFFQSFLQSFNRISIGIQSFNDRQLRRLGRIHDAETARLAVRAAQEAGFKNIGIDLMWGLPGQTLEELEKDIDDALALGIQHISAYQLTIGDGLHPLPVWAATEGRPYGTGRASSATTLPDEDMAHEMFLLVHDKLTAAGYEHYEISNFAKGKTFRCRHNLNYWRYGEWLGVGSGATSFIACHCERQRSNPVRSIEFTGSPRPSRFTRGSRDDSHLIRFTSTKDISKYLRHEFSYDVEEIPLKSAIAEYSFMNLRTSDGIDFNDFKRRFSREFDYFYPKLREKWLKNGQLEANRLTLSGWLISDELFRELI